MKKIISLLLVIMMVCTMLPSMAFAADIAESSVSVTAGAEKTTMPAGQFIDADFYSGNKQNTFEFILKFDANGGTGTFSDITDTKDTEYTYVQYVMLQIPEDYRPAREGYTFKGWEDANGYGTVYQPGDFVNVNRTNTGCVKTDKSCTMTLTAQWAQNFTVTYNDGVDSEEIFKDQTYIVESGTATPAFKGTPTRDGYKFIGWTPAVADTVTENATYEAQWESKSEKLIKELLSDIKVECVSDSSHTAKEYDTSVGGFSAITLEKGKGKFTSTITVDAERYVGQYNKDTGKTHQLVSREAETRIIVVEFDSSYSKDSVTLKSGTLPVTFKVTCAQPQPDQKYTLTYDANGGTLNSGMTNSITGKTAGDTVDLDYTNQPTHEPQDGKNVIFLGWTMTDTKGKVYANGEDLPDLVKKVTFEADNITVYAVWGLDANADRIPDALEAKVTYKIENGEWFDSSNPNPGSTVTGRDKVVYIPLYEKNDDGIWTKIDANLGTTIPTGHRGNTGYISDGWYKDSDAERTEISADTKVTGNVTYTFKYVKKAEIDTYTVVLHLDGGAYTTVPAGYTAISGGYSYTLSAATDTVNPDAATLNKSGYEFKGWSLSDTAPKTLIGKNETFASLSFQQNGLEGNHNQITLYAVWEYNGYIPPVDPAPTTGTLTVTKTVTGFETLPEGYSVTINVKQGDKFIRTATLSSFTDGRATYSFYGLPAGTYTVSETAADVDGYKLEATADQSVTVTAG